MSHATEVAYNLSLARLLRHEGLNAEGEQRHRFGKARGQADVILDFDDYAAVIEAEFGDPARSDADKRLPSGAPAVVNGLSVRLVVAVGYPPRLARLPESGTDANLAGINDLRFACRYFGEEWGAETTGSVANLSELLRDYWIQSDNGVGIEEIVKEADHAIETATEILARVERDDDDGQDASATKALIWLNALTFHELLVRDLDMSLLPPEHSAKTIRPPLHFGTALELAYQWREILKINWWPIFHVASETLINSVSPANRWAIEVLMAAARKIAESGMIRRHDVAGRIFHRLLDSRKFLATNYTTIPAAIVLAGLAFDDRSGGWFKTDFSSTGSVAKLRIVDPACGSGTLLVAAAQEIIKRARRAGSSPQETRDVVRTILENAIYGFDVVPAAIHLAASTLCMAEARQVIANMNLWRVRHDVSDGVPRLGSLDFLSTSPSMGNAARLSLFETDGISVRVTGSGEVDDDVAMPSGCDLVIANPPYTRAGGPGDRENTVWNPIFGSILDKRDSQAMKSALRKTLANTPASLYAGLGSAFVLLAHEALDVGGRMAFVLPATMLTGSRWKSIRKLLLRNYAIEWVVVSHDIRNRTARRGLPGRRLVSFSESTRIAEVLIVATRERSAKVRHNRVHFANLLRNPDEPVEAMGLMRKLLEMRDHMLPLEPAAIDIGGGFWGNVVAVPQEGLPREDSWLYATFVQPGLALTAERIAAGHHEPLASVPIARLGDVAELGPYHMQIKNPTQGLFRIAESTAEVDPAWELGAGIPALWRHKATRNTSLHADADARLERRSDRSRTDQERMLARGGRLHLAADLGMAPQRVSAVLTENPMLGVSSWISVIPRRAAHGKEQALCLWLNSSFGLLLRIVHGNRPYLGRSRVPHELARTMPVLDIDLLSPEQLVAAARICAELRDRELQGFSGLANDEARGELNRRLCKEVLGIDPAVAADLTNKLAREPTLQARH